jgi:thioredoxin reductase
MAEPSILPLRSPLSFAAGSRETILDSGTRSSPNTRSTCATARVTAISGQKGAFALTLKDKSTISAEAVVLAIGLQGNLRKLGVPGEDHERVFYQLDDPKESEDETIIVVGAGDAAIEYALALAEQNRVIMINRNEEFSRCKEGNLTLVLAAIQDGKIEIRYQAAAASVEAVETDGCPARFNAKTPDGAEAIGCHRVIARLGATPPRKLVESFGIKFPNADPASVPQLTDTYESNVAGLYIIGALGGYPLIKQAMNQGYEVVEYIRGNRVDPADEPLLKQKFENYKRARTVSHGLILLQKNVAVCSLASPRCNPRVPARQRYPHARARRDHLQSQRLQRHVLFDRGRRGRHRAQWRHARGAMDGPAHRRFLRRAVVGLGRRRAATVKASLGCVLIETPRRSMLKLIASVDSVRRTIDAAFLKRAVRAHLAPDLTDEDLDALTQGAQLKSCAAGETLFTEGSAADGLYLIRRGSVTVSRRIGGHDVVLSYVAAGNYVGEMALLSDAPRMGTVRASGDRSDRLDGARFADGRPAPEAPREPRGALSDRIRANV